MADQPSEEKSLPASEKKLREARKKGQVDKSTDMVTAMVITAATLYVGYCAPRLYAHFLTLFQYSSDAWSLPFDEILPRGLKEIKETITDTIFPLIAITIVISILTNITIIRGFIFSTEPVIPKFERINPAAGMKRIFSLRSVIELLKSLIKMTILAAALVTILFVSLQMLMNLPECGFECIGGGFFALLKPIIITVLIAFILVGSIDILLQRWLFRRDQRMTKTEKKREQKDMSGDPQIKRAFNRLRQELQVANRKLTIKDTSMVIGRPGGWMVGLRYVKGETPAPLVTFKASPEQSQVIHSTVRGYGFPTSTQSDLAEKIASKTVKGDPIPTHTFQPVANLLSEFGLV